MRSNEQEATTLPSSPSSFSRISPLILLVIIVLAVIFFVYGLIHLVLWFFMKITPPSSSLYINSNRLRESTRSRALQHLFRANDSGLGQSLIDSLPVFSYRDLFLRSKEPFDCAVCLCEFSYQDKLRLVPVCGHAFHTNCIDTWLVSNSTCPLCRATVLSSSSSMENHQVFGVESSCVVSNWFEEENVCCSNEEEEEEEQVVGKRVFSVRLGKFKNSGEVLGGGSGSSLDDGRRCYSMGSYQYVVRRDSNLRVVLSESHGDDVSGNEGVDDGKRMIGNNRTRGESFSVSKIWLWSNKSRYHGTSDLEISSLIPLQKLPQVGVS